MGSWNNQSQTAMLGHDNQCALSSQRQPRRLTYRRSQNTASPRTRETGHQQGGYCQYTHQKEIKEARPEAEGRSPNKKTQATSQIQDSTIKSDGSSPVGSTPWRHGKQAEQYFPSPSLGTHCHSWGTWILRKRAPTTIPRLLVQIGIYTWLFGPWGPLAEQVISGPCVAQAGLTVVTSPLFLEVGNGCL